MNQLEKKIRSVYETAQLTNVATITEDSKPWVRYVMSQMDDSLTVRFSTFLGSRKVNHIKKNPQVHLTCGVSSLENAQRYLQIQGHATVSDSADEKKAFWHESLRAYFKGPDDPNYLIVIVKPERIEYMTMSSMKPEVWQAP